MEELDEKKLWELAVAAREYSYSPYSGFKVGAALLSRGGKVFRDATLKMQLTARRIAQRGVPSFRRYPRENVILKRLPSLEERMSL